MPIADLVQRDCFWSRCSNRKRCDAFGSCVAKAQAGGAAWPTISGQPDSVLLTRALGILHRMATEQTGWRGFFFRWYYGDEPLRNDAANLVRDAGFGMPMPLGTRLIGDDGVADGEQQTREE